MICFTVGASDLDTSPLSNEMVLIQLPVLESQY
jgi:hypothetical protein